ncbi:MAG: hypothetical protein LBT39_07015 [Treponema sp.]|jgi:hypothetical protein|nr:hypothetical protein [Treponema sp.]
MANEKKPSIYHDRGTIGSAKELDEYGVWVKSEPQDLVSEGVGPEDQNFALDSLDELPDFSTGGLDTGSEDLDLSLPGDDFNLDDFDTSSLTGIDESTGDDLSTEGDTPEDESSTDDFSIPEDDSLSLDSLDDLSFSISDDAPDTTDTTEETPDLDFSISETSEDSGDLDLSLPEDDALDLSLDNEDLSLPEETPVEVTEGPTEDGEFTEISIEDLLGGVADEAPGEDKPEKSSNADISTQLLMKIADELSSIRAELSTLKDEFSSIRTTAETSPEAEASSASEISLADETILADEGESDESTSPRGFFDDAEDDKIALTGDELNNILNTADFTEEAGADAAEEDLSPEEPGISNELDLTAESLEGPIEESIEEPLEEEPIEETLEEHIEEPLEEPTGETLDLSEVDNLNEEVSLDIGEVDTLSLDSLDDFALEEPSPEDEVLLAAEEPATEPTPEPEEPALEISEDPIVDIGDELSLVDLSDESITADFTGSEITLEETPEISEDAALSLDDLDTPVLSEEESITLDSFDEEALDLTGAVIDEPDLGVEIQENPPLEPAPGDIAVLDEGLLEVTEEAPPEETLAEILPSPVDEVEDETEIAKAEGSAAEIPAVRGNASHGEDLNQIIPEGFIVEDLDEEMPEGFGGAGLDTLEEGISLDEIPEDILPEDEEAPVAVTAREAVEEPEVSGLPGNFRQELKHVLSYMDQLLESLPEEKIEEFARSEYFDTYKKLFKELGLA